MKHHCIYLSAVLSLLSLLLNSKSLYAQSLPGHDHEKRLAELIQPGASVPEAFGVNIHFYDHEAGMDAVRQLGARWIRQDFFWSNIERTKSVYSFDHTDKLVQDAAARNIRILAILDYENKIYCKTRAIKTAEERQAFVNYAVATIRRYQDKKIIWEIWNEPNNGGFWIGNSPEEYMALLRDVCQAVRREIPDAVLIGPSTYKMPDAYMEKCLQLDLLDHVDAISFHPYQRQRPEKVIDDMARLRQLVAKYLKKDRNMPPIICSEWGFSATHHNVEGQACRVPRSLFLSLMEKMPVTIYYDLLNDGLSPSNSEHNYGLVTSHPYLVPKPAGLAFLTASRVMNGFTFSRRVNVADENQPNHFVLEFSKEKEKSYVHWCGTAEDSEIAWKLPKEFGTVTRVNQYGQQLPGILLAGDRVISKAQVEYLMPTVAAARNSWRLLARLTPDAVDGDKPWKTDLQLSGPGQSGTVNPVSTRRYDTGFRDWDSGTMDVWVKPSADDFGKYIVVGGDLDKKVQTLRIGLDKKGNVTATHWTWPSKQWLPALTTNQPVIPEQWTRITYQWGAAGQRLFIDGQQVASAITETGGIAFSMAVRAEPLRGTVGFVQMIRGVGYMP